MTQIREQQIHIFLFSLIASSYLYLVEHTRVEYGRPEACSPEWEQHMVDATQEENTDPSIYTYFKINKLHFIFNIHTSNTLSV